jgi:hypothetical protein
MRSITLMGAAAVVLSATTLLAVPASADRVCKQVCDNGSQLEGPGISFFCCRSATVPPFTSRRPIP